VLSISSNNSFIFQRILLKQLHGHLSSELCTINNFAPHLKVFSWNKNRKDASGASVRTSFGKSYAADRIICHFFPCSNMYEPSNFCSLLQVFMVYNLDEYVTTLLPKFPYLYSIIHCAVLLDIMDVSHPWYFASYAHCSFLLPTSNTNLLFYFLNPFMSFFFFFFSHCDLQK
jgi:hypothetical protein